MISGLFSEYLKYSLLFFHFQCIYLVFTVPFGFLQEYFNHFLNSIFALFNMILHCWWNVISNINIQFCGSKLKYFSQPCINAEEISKITAVKCMCMHTHKHTITDSLIHQQLCFLLLCLCKCCSSWGIRPHWPPPSQGLPRWLQLIHREIWQSLLSGSK